MDFLSSEKPIDSIELTQNENYLEGGDCQLDIPFRDYSYDRRVNRRPFEGPDRRSVHGRRGGGAVEDFRQERRSSKTVYRFRKSYLLQQLFLMMADILSLVVALLIPAATMGLFVVEAVSSNSYLASAYWQFCIVAVLFLSLNWLRGNYSKRRTITNGLGELMRMVFVVVGVQSTLAGIVGSRSVLLGLLVAWVIALILIPFVRLAVKRLMYIKGIWTRPTIIIGSGENAVKTAEALQSDWLLGVCIVEFIGGVEEYASGGGKGSPFSEKIKPFIEIMGHRIPVRRLKEVDGEMFNRMGNPHIVVATDSQDFWHVVRLLYDADIPYTSLTIAPSLGGVPLIGLGMTHVFKHDVLMLTVQNNLARFIPRLVKRGFDIVASFLLLVLISPLMFFVALLVRMSGKNIFYGHERVGQKGESFKCYKFRSMRNDSKEVLEELLRSDEEARAEWERDFKLKNDPRITRIGHFIRQTSIDELPQLWNVLVGDMSLVGPRPVISDEIERYQDKQDLYHMVRPGITGLWQISGRNDVTYEERVNLDSWYSQNWSLWYDLVILIKTVRVVLRRSGAY